MSSAGSSASTETPPTSRTSSPTARVGRGRADRPGAGKRAAKADDGKGRDAFRAETEPRQAPLLVLKVGTSSLMVSDSTGSRVQLSNVAQLVDLIGVLHRRGYQVVLVSSGAVGMGCIKLGLSQKPADVRTKQAVAAAGQSQLIRMYEDLFGTVQLKVAQLLISQSDFLDKDHWGNVKATIQECLKLGLVPIVNENDSTNTADLRFGDNDNLAALTAVQLEADALFLFTDVDYLYTANPRSDPDAQPLRVVAEPWALQVDTSDAGSGLGTGGMETKIVAARTASTAGIPCGLINGQHPSRLLTFLEYGIGTRERGPHDASQGEGPLPEGTCFMAMEPDRTVCDTRRWIVSLPASAELRVDDGCARALADEKSLLPSGILKVQGQFTRHECVRLVHRGGEIARGIVNFSSEELVKIRGCRSNEFEGILGYSVCAEACDVSNVMMTVDADSLRDLGLPGKLPTLGGKTAGLRRNTTF